MAPRKKPTPPAGKKTKTTSSAASASATKKRATRSPSSSLSTMVTRSSSGKTGRNRLVEGLKSDSDVKRKANKAKGKSASRKKKAKPDDAPPKVNEAAGGSGKGKEPDVGGADEEGAGTEEESDDGDDDGDGDGDDEEEPGGGKGVSVIIMACDIGLFKRKTEELKDCMGGATPDMILRMNPEKVLSLSFLSGWVLFSSLLNLTPRLRSLIQPWVIARVFSDTPLILRIQSKHNGFLDGFFSVMSCIVSVPFYTGFIPLLFWSGHSRLGRQIALLMAFCDYIGNTLKENFRDEGINWMTFHWCIRNEAIAV